MWQNNQPIEGGRKLVEKLKVHYSYVTSTVGLYFLDTL